MGQDGTFGRRKTIGRRKTTTNKYFFRSNVSLRTPLHWLQLNTGKVIIIIMTTPVHDQIHAPLERQRRPTEQWPLARSAAAPETQALAAAPPVHGTHVSVERQKAVRVEKLLQRWPDCRLHANKPCLRLLIVISRRLSEAQTLDTSTATCMQLHVP
jgi:hypothetical protein